MYRLKVFLRRSAGSGPRQFLLLGPSFGANCTVIYKGPGSFSCLALLLGLIVQLFIKGEKQPMCAFDLSAGCEYFLLKLLLLSEMEK